MNAVIDRLYAEGHPRDADGSPLDAYSSFIQEESGRLLYDLVRAERPERSAEVGLAYGLSALHICQALEENGRGYHRAMDPSQSAVYRGVGVLNVERAGLTHRFGFREAPAHVGLPALLEEHGPHSHQFVLIDGMHTFDHTLTEFFLADHLLAVGGVVAIDDLWMPAIQRCLSFVLRNRPYELVPIDAARYGTPRRRLFRAARRMLTAPVRLPLDLRRYPLNTCALRKRAHDRRAWDHYRPF